MKLWFDECFIHKNAIALVIVIAFAEVICFQECASYYEGSLFVIVIAMYFFGVKPNEWIKGANCVSGGIFLFLI